MHFSQSLHKEFNVEVSDHHTSSQACSHSAGLPLELWEGEEVNRPLRLSWLVAVIFGLDPIGKLYLPHGAFQLIVMSVV
jgi:hypothetical protein